MVQGHGVAPGVKLQATLVGLRHGQAGPWVASGVYYSQETVLYLNFHVLELGKLVGAVRFSDTLCLLLFELHRTLVCDDVSLPSLASTLWNRFRAAFAPSYRAVVPSFHC